MNIKNLLKLIRLVVFDFDGVMTDDTVYIDQFGHEMVRVSRADGLAINILKKQGLSLLVLSTEDNPVVEKRAEKLDIPVLHSVGDKATALKQYVRKNGFDLRETLYVGNDLNDIEVMEIVGVSVSPSNANRAVRKISKIKLKTSGGSGVIRELADLW